jgi:hypothetical protein
MVTLFHWIWSRRGLSHIYSLHWISKWLVLGWCRRAMRTWMQKWQGWIQWLKAPSVLSRTKHCSIWICTRSLSYHSSPRPKLLEHSSLQGVSTSSLVSWLELSHSSMNSGSCTWEHRFGWTLGACSKSWYKWRAPNRKALWIQCPKCHTNYSPHRKICFQGHTWKLPIEKSRSMT